MDRVRAFIGRYRSDRAYRAHVAIVSNFAVNLAFAFYEAICGFVFRSPWMGTMAFYYIVLSFMRFMLLRSKKKGDERRMWRAYGRTGIIMPLLIIVMTGIHILSLSGSHSFRYPWHLIYGVAAYTFYALVNAIRNAVKYRTSGDPALMADKAMRLSVAAVSLYNLQSALIDAFGEGNGVFKRNMGIILWSAVCIFILSLSFHMLLVARRKNGK